MSDSLHCDCVLETVSGGDITFSYGSDRDCTCPFTAVNQGILIFTGNDSLITSRIVSLTIGLDSTTGIIENSQGIADGTEVLACANRGSFFCCTDDYNTDGIIDYKDSALFRVWTESNTDSASELNTAYASKKKECSNDGGWPDTTACVVPSLPCADFNGDESITEFDSDAHTAYTHLYGNVNPE